MLECKFCKQTLADSKFTNFPRNPVLAKERKGKVYVCRDCANAYVHERDNSIESLKEILKVQDMPFIEHYARQAKENYIKKLKNTNTITTKNEYSGEVKKERKSITIQTSIYSCYCTRIGVIPREYINYSYSDGIRDMKLEEKLKKANEILKEEKDENLKKAGSAKRFVNKLLGGDYFHDENNLYQMLEIKIKEMDIKGKDESKYRVRKHSLKTHIENLVELNLLEKDFKELFVDKEELEEAEIPSNTNMEIKNSAVINSVIEKEKYDMSQLRSRWIGFPDYKVVMLEKKYNELKENYEIMTSLHDEFLKLACIASVEGALSFADGDFTNAKKNIDMFNKLTSAGKLQPKQFSKADLSGGLNNFSDFYKSVEEVVGDIDVLEILPHIGKVPQDHIDIILYCIIQYQRRLKDLPDCTYEDIWAFYDEMAEDISDLYGDIEDGGIRLRGEQK